MTRVMILSNNKKYKSINDSKEYRHAHTLKKTVPQNKTIQPQIDIIICVTYS